MANIKTDAKQEVQKSMKYSVKVKFINFDPAKFASRIIIVDGVPALKIKERVYIKLK